MKLTSYERILRIFQNKEIDRPALKLWGYEPNLKLVHPEYAPVCEAAQKTDVFLTVECDMNMYSGKKYEHELIEREYRESRRQLKCTSGVSFFTVNRQLFT